jgi:hypothetical protein
LATPLNALFSPVYESMRAQVTLVGVLKPFFKTSASELSLIAGAVACMKLPADICLRTWNATHGENRGAGAQND